MIFLKVVKNCIFLFRQKVLLHLLYAQHNFFVVQYFVIFKLTGTVFNVVLRSVIYFVGFLFCVKAGEDEADNPLQSDDMLSPSVLRCYTLYPNE